MMDEIKKYREKVGNSKGKHF